MPKSLPELARELLAENNLAPASVKITAAGSSLFLQGKLDTWDQVVLAGHLAGSLRGVDNVVNKLKARETAKNDRRPPFASSTSPAIHLGRTDIVIIGGGIIGCAIARELSRYRLDIILLEKEADVSCGASKANNGMVHSGINQEPGTLRSKLNIRGNALFENFCRELDVPFYRSSLLTLIIREEDLFLLDLVKARGDQEGIPIEIISREEALRLEPALNPEIKGAFLAPSTAMTSPYKLTIACAENAVENGARILLNTAVNGLAPAGNRLIKVMTSRGYFMTRCCINAAGIYADYVAAMTGSPEFTLHPRKGELIIFDPSGSKKHPRIPVGTLATGQDPFTKGGGIMITTDGNPEWGPTAVELPDREDTSVTAGGLEKVLAKFIPLVPSYNPEKMVISYFAGVRAATYTEDFHIRPSSSLKGLINVAGIQSPGLAAAPAIAGMVVEMVREEGLTFKENKAFQAVRCSPIRFRALSTKEKDNLIKKNPAYGRLVCRCEQVTEGEIIEAIRSPLPAQTLDAIKRRTRAGMGRCQGGFCTPRLLDILSRELGLPFTKLTKNGPGSELLKKSTRTVD